MQSQLDLIEMKLEVVMEIVDAIPDWIPLTSTLAEQLGYTRQGLREKMFSTLEPEREYRKIGKYWHFHKSVLHRMRKRRKNEHQD
jgi:hypothetical protein